MINTEKLLGKIVAGSLQSGFGTKKKRKKKDDLLGGLISGLSSGKGLITAIGLGVGAYEILKGTSASGPSIPEQPSSPPSVQPSASSVPPPLPPRQSAQSAPPLPPAANEQEQTNAQDLALRLIQTMIAAAHADGVLDEEEEQFILEKLQQEQELNHEEKRFLLAQLHQPKRIDELVAGINQPAIAQTMYSLAASTIVIDTREERQWLDQLAAALSLSDKVKQFIETNG